MERSLTTQDLITLPRLNAAEAVVLATELMTAADAWVAEEEGRELPPAIGRSRGRLAAACGALDGATRPQVLKASRPNKRTADRAVDNAWSATADWLGGWCKLPVEANPHREQAQALTSLIFPDALAFTRLPYKMEWRESQARLDAIAEHGHDETFKTLGGEAFLSHIGSTQDAYGRALQITEALPPPPPAADTRKAFLALLGALRDYAGRVVTHTDPDVPGSKELSDSLIRPLATWESRIAAATAAPEEDAAPGEGEGSPEPQAEP